MGRDDDDCMPYMVRGIRPCVLCANPFTQIVIFACNTGVRVVRACVLYALKYGKSNILELVGGGARHSLLNCFLSVANI